MDSKHLAAFLSVTLACVTAPSDAGIITKEDMEGQRDGVAHSAASAHEVCLAMLDDLAKAQPTAASLIEHNDIASLTKLHEGVHERMSHVREQMDRAILAGAWRDTSARTQALDLLSRLEGIRILNKMNLAFLNGYPHATETVSPSVADATQRMFSQIVILRDEMRRVNSLSKAAAQSAAKR